MCLQVHMKLSAHIFRGVAQLVAHRIWDARAASSNLVTPTRKTDKFRLVGFSTKSTLAGG